MSATDNGAEAEGRSGDEAAAIHELRVEALSAGGDGVARLDGKTIFVPDAAPGDLLRARLGRDKGRWAKAVPLELLEPGKSRVEPPCPVAGTCGGCQWQQVSADAQRDARIAILEEALRRIAGLSEWPAIEFVAGETFGYRRRAL
jgi:23S rRNA (uracil1939-C5)-methyltransferase